MCANDTTLVKTAEARQKTLRTTIDKGATLHLQVRYWWRGNTNAANAAFGALLLLMLLLLVLLLLLSNVFIGSS